jgi:hypothetical protein
MKNGNRNDKHYVTDSEDNESPNNGNNTDKELGNFNDVMTWLDVQMIHNTYMHGKSMVIGS